MSRDTASPLNEWIRKHASYPHEIRLLKREPDVLVRVQQPPGLYERNAGNEMNLMLVTRGSGHCRSAHGDLVIDAPLTTGSLCLSPARTDLAYQTNAPNEFTVMTFAQDDDRIIEALDGRPDFGCLHTLNWNDREIGTLMSQSWSALENGTHEGALYAEGARLMVLARLIHRSTGKSMPVRNGGLTAAQTRRSLELMTETMENTLSLEDLAKNARLSVFHYARAFKQTVGVAPHSYMMTLRTQKACELLASTNLPITEIAFRVGYQSSQALARVFAREMGTTPSTWRREKRS